MNGCVICDWLVHPSCIHICNHTPIFLFLTGSVVFKKLSESDRMNLVSLLVVSGRGFRVLIFEDKKL
jgi:hypothetical protein